MEETMIEEYPRRVELKDGSWTYVDKTGKLWEQRFKAAGPFDDGLAAVQLDDGRDVCVDRNGEIYQKKYINDLRVVYVRPESFMTLPTEKFADKEFVEAAVKQVKISLTDMVAGKDVVDDECVEYVKELLSNVKEKVNKEKENIKLEEMEKEKTQKEQKKQDLMNEIKGFEL